MKALDHDTFHAMEIDALYDELDAGGSSAIREHAASCESCGSRFERMRRTRQRGLSALAEAVPQDFESRVMAAVDAALAKRAGSPVLVPKLQSVSPAPPAALKGPGKVIPFFARPSFAVAATMILVLGAAAILSQMGMKRAAPMATSADDQTAVVAAAPAAQAAPAASAAADPSPPEAKPAVVAAATAPAEERPSDRTKNGKQPAESEENLLALGEAPAAPRAASPAPPPPPMAAPAKAARPSSASGGATSGSSDPAFASALALYNAGRYAEALPRFEALKANNPEADLYAARCVQRSAQGCAAAAPRFDAIARRYKGSAVGSRAQLEAGTCYQQMNNVQAARSRYQAAKDEGPFAAEAARDLDALEGKGGQAGPAATTSPGTPGGSKASPKKPAATPPEAQPTESSH